MRLHWALFVPVLGLMAGSAEASPLTFEFVLTWSSTTNAGLFGTSATLDLTVDNGNASSLSQTYTFGQVTQASILTNGSLNANFAPVTTGLHPADVIFTTSASGVPTIFFGLNSTNVSVLSPPFPFSPSLQFNFNNPSATFIVFSSGSDPFATTARLSPTVRTVVGTGPQLQVSQLVGIDDLGSKTGADQYIRFPDHTTGVAQVVGGLGSSFNQVDGMAVLRGLDQAPDRVFGADNNRLVEINPNTGAATPIGPIGFSLVDGLCFQPQTRALFGVTYGSNKIIRIDISTGQGSVVASHVMEGHRLNDMTFSPDGRMFIVTNDRPPKLYEVNPTTGAKINKWVLSGTNQIEAILWSLDGGTLYCGALRGGFSDLATVDFAAQRVVFVGTEHSGSRDIEALAWIGGTSTPTCVLCPPANKPAPAAVSGLRLYPNVPNPFNPTTRIAFDLPQGKEVSLSVHDAAGHRVATLVRGPTSAGHHEVDWTGISDRGLGVPSGVYFYTLRAGSQLEKRRMLLLK